MAQTVARTVARNAPSFRLGENKVFLPSHVISLLRRDSHPPNWATFRVPVRFNKFDIRDYLWNLYRIETTAVRSWVKQSPLERKGEGRGALFRPAPKKFMTVEMTRPFVWPETPEDKEPWNNKLFQARQARQELNYKNEGLRQEGKLPYPSKMPQNKETQEVRKKAQQLLRGDVKWESDAKLDEKWVDGKTQ